MKTTNKKLPFQQRHQHIYYVLSLVATLILLIFTFVIVYFFIKLLGKGILGIAAFLKEFVSSKDKVIIVAMFTDSTSLIGVLNK